MRKSDTEKKIYFRASERIFNVDGQWFFTTREGDEGPFVTRKAAESHMRTYIDTQQLTGKRLQTREQELKVLREERRGDPTLWDRQIDSL